MHLLNIVTNFVDLLHAVSLVVTRCNQLYFLVKCPEIVLNILVLARGQRREEVNGDRNTRTLF